MSRAALWAMCRPGWTGVGPYLALITAEGRMAALIHEHATRVRTPEGELFSVRTWGEQDGNLWRGWLEFVPLGGTGPTLRTDGETTQPSEQALQYWAEGLEPLYFEGAFERAQIVRVRSA
jgi:hypothetical protein